MSKSTKNVEEIQFNVFLTKHLHSHSVEQKSIQKSDLNELVNGVKKSVSSKLGLTNKKFDLQGLRARREEWEFAIQNSFNPFMRQLHMTKQLDLEMIMEKDVLEEVEKKVNNQNQSPDIPKEKVNIPEESKEKVKPENDGRIINHLPKCDNNLTKPRDKKADEEGEVDEESQEFQLRKMNAKLQLKVNELTYMVEKHEREMQTYSAKHKELREHNEKLEKSMEIERKKYEKEKEEREKLYMEMNENKMKRMFEKNVKKNNPPEESGSEGESDDEDDDELKEILMTESIKMAEMEVEKYKKSLILKEEYIKKLMGKYSTANSDLKASRDNNLKKKQAIKTLKKKEQNLKEQMKKVKEELDRLKKKFSSLDKVEQFNTTLKSEKNRLLKENTKLIQKNSKMTSKLTKLRSDNEKLRVDFKKMKNNNSSILDEQKTEVDRLKKEFKERESQLERNFSRKSIELKNKMVGKIEEMKAFMEKREREFAEQRKAREEKYKEFFFQREQKLIDHYKVKENEYLEEIKDLKERSVKTPTEPEEMIDKYDTFFKFKDMLNE